MTTLTRRNQHAEVNIRHAVGNRHTAQWMLQQLMMGDPLDKYGPRVHELFDDFYGAINEDLWTELDDGTSGTDLATDEAGGVWSLVTAAADNDYKARSSIGEHFLFAADKPLLFDCRVKISEGTEDEAAFWVGLTDTLTTGGFQANTSGPLASYDGALWFKNEAGTTLNFENSNASTQDTEADIFTFPDDTWLRLAFFFDGVGSIRPYYNLAGGMDLTEGPLTTISLTGLEEMHAVVGVKAGPTAAAETFKVDYVRVAQVR